MQSELAAKALKGLEISREEALLLAASISGEALFEFFSHASRIRAAWRGDTVELCSIISARTGACSEDCSYCAQSQKAASNITPHPLMHKADVLKHARKAKSRGAKRFCIVTSGKKPAPRELVSIAEMLEAVKAEGLLPCATLGLLNETELAMLKAAGLQRYHHNLETSERFFSSVCTTHTYEEKLQTIHAAKAAGLSLCSGGIFGLGESWEDRVDMALALRELNTDSVPINFLIPMPGTRLEHTPPLHPFEALKIISLYRFLLPDKEIRVCGGRAQTLKEFNSFVLMAGADGLLTGDCLTSKGVDFEDDLRLIDHYGLRRAH